MVYLTLEERSYPKKLSLSFLEEVSKEYDIQYLYNHFLYG